jgi:hypothetical protein
MSTKRRSRKNHVNFRTTPPADAARIMVRKHGPNADTMTLKRADIAESLECRGFWDDVTNEIRKARANATTDRRQTMTPAELDTELLEILDKHDRAVSRRTGLLRVAVRDLERGLGTADAVAAAEGELAQDKKARKNAVLPYDAEFARRGGWARYYKVANVNGHVHSSNLDCSTCFRTTLYVWLTQLSGLDAKEMVAVMGDTACTVCYPSAPTFRGYNDGNSVVARLSASEKQARRDEKAAKVAAKEAATITVDGETFKTERSARIAITDAMVYVAWDYRQFKTPEARAHVRQIAAAIGEKNGTDADTVLAEQLKKANAEIRKTNRDGPRLTAHLRQEWTDAPEITIEEFTS